MTNLVDLKTEEDVKVKFLLPFLRKKGYLESYCDFNVAVEVQEGRKRKSIFADIVVYTSSAKVAPLIVCETKSPSEVLDRFTKEQAISYARLMPRIAPLVLLTNGAQLQVFQTLNKNRIGDLPDRRDLHRDLLNFFVSAEVKEALRAEAKHDLFIIEDVQTFKNVLKSCHNEIRNNEGYDPTAAFDEMSKVLFCKLYEEKRHNDNRFRLSVFDDSLERLKVNVVKQVFDETKIDPKYASLFDADATINLQDRTIRKIVSLFENYDLSLTAFDVKGEAFEYFLSDTFTGGLGEYFTPRNIVEFMVEAVDPKIGEKIIDPFCGTGGFLIYAFETISEKIRLQQFSEDEKERWRFELSNRSLYGTDWKERTSQACKMNMMVHGDGSVGIFKHHGLTNIEGQIEEGKFDLCLTNPPFGSFENDPEVLKLYDLGAGRQSQSRVALALERALRLAKPNRWVGIIVIDGILNNPKHKYVREYIKQQSWVRGVISLCKETFQAYGSEAKTSILFLQKKPEPDDGEQDAIFMAVATNTGYAPNGAPIPGNELPDILLEYKAFLNGQTVAKHNCWITSRVSDRLDAEFYWLRDAGQIDISPIQLQVTSELQNACEQYAAIRGGIILLSSKVALDIVSVNDLLEEVSIREKVKPEQNYRLLGVRGQGGGAFIREEKRGSEIKSKTLFRVHQGWVIYNRLFAARGSFAVLQLEHDGCYVSGEFPTFKVKHDVSSPDFIAKYVVHCLNSPVALNLVESQSTGSTKTSRNRFNQKSLLLLKVKIPKSIEHTQAIVTLMDSADSLRITQASLLEHTKDLWNGISGLLPHPEL